MKEIVMVMFLALCFCQIIKAQESHQIVFDAKKSMTKSKTKLMLFNAEDLYMDVHVEKVYGSDPPPRIESTVVFYGKKLPTLRLSTEVLAWGAEDLNLDGQTEIILKTYGGNGNIIMYSFYGLNKEGTAWYQVLKPLWSHIHVNNCNIRLKYDQFEDKIRGSIPDINDDNFNCKEQELKWYAR